jgi:hypothetical protein
LNHLLRIFNACTALSLLPYLVLCLQELLAMPAHNANSRVAGLMKAWNFPNNYTLSKHLAEYMVADFHKYCKLPIVIARPTLISSVARDPYPGVWDT